MRLAMRNVSTAAEKGSMVNCGTIKKTSERFLICILFIAKIHARGAMTYSLRGMRRADVLKATLAWKNAAGKSKYATLTAI
ncbi:hypothetical protein RHECNPAF_990024 [Rhizobium etli CNPAF512]|nr:hypothetical protein RHECNPAF_990024 [Rhizobium etli CNPAF512]